MMRTNHNCITKPVVCYDNYNSLQIVFTHITHTYTCVCYIISTKSICFHCVMAINEMKLHWANIENEMSNFGCFDIFGGAIKTGHNPKCSHIIILHIYDFMKRLHLLNVDSSSSWRHRPFVCCAVVMCFFLVPSISFMERHISQIWSEP